jgi:zinc protease
MKRSLLLLSILLSGNLFAQLKPWKLLFETEHLDPTISFQKYVLPNGLALLSHEDHTQPIVHVDVTYHVGFARENRQIGLRTF